MIDKKKRVKLISASAVALLAITGTAYGTGLADENSVNEGQEVQELNIEQQEEVTEEVVEVDEETTEEGTTEEGEVTEDEVTEDEVTEDEVTSEDETEDEETEDEETSEDETEEEQEETREVNAELEVPFEDLPIDEETGMLDFVAYHEIANGRAMPRPLTEDEEEYYRVYIEEGYYEEIRVSVTETEYEFLYVYPREFYSPDSESLKYHKYVEIRSELLVLEEQQLFLEEQEEMVRMSESIGEVYDKELGYFVQIPTQDDYIDHETDGYDDITDDTDFSTDPVENDNPEEEKYYEEQDILENLTDYDRMTEEEFKEAYGFNFLFRAVVPEGGIYQEEYELDNGLTLVVEAESMLSEEKGNEDTISIVWGVVRDVIRLEEGDGVFQKGQYNLATNINSPYYIGINENPDASKGEERIATGDRKFDLDILPNVVASGQDVLREDGEYTPKKAYIEIMKDQIPHMYLMVADAIHEGEEQPLYSDIVAYIEYGWGLGYTKPEDEIIEGEDGKDESDGEGTDGEGTDGEGTDGGVTDPEVIDPEVTDPEVTDPEATDPEVTDPEVTDPERTDTDEREGDSSEQDSKEDKKERETSERFQQTGTSIVWGSILTGLGLGALGTYFYKKNNKEDEVDADEE